MTGVLIHAKRPDVQEDPSVPVWCSYYALVDLVLRFKQENPHMVLFAIDLATRKVGQGEGCRKRCREWCRITGFS